MKTKPPPNPSVVQDPGKYLQLFLYPWLVNISTGLRKLQFDENFDSFTASNVTIASGDTARINNAFKVRGSAAGVIPSGRIIIKQTGGGIVSDGAWTPETIEMINNGPGAVTVSIIFFR